MIRYGPTQSGGRLLTGDTEYGSFEFELNADNQLLPGWRHTFREPRKLTCEFLGDVMRLIDCPGCGGKTQLKIFVCVIHGECTIERNMTEVPGCCAGCAEYSPKG